jgi:hypothetical protein
MDLMEFLRGGWRRDRLPVLIAVTTAVFSLAYGLIAFQVTSNSLMDWPGIFSRWDASHYETIARLGYSASPDRAFHICFFPLFPLLAAPFAWLFGNATIATLLVANLAAIAGFVCFHRLAALELGEEAAGISLVALAIFPTAYFFHLGYTESLFLATSTAAFLTARTSAWAWVGLFALLASLTRMTGLVLVPALFVEYLHQTNFQFRRIRPSILFVFTPFVGMAIYMGLNVWLFGDPLRFLDIQAKAFFKSLSWPWVGFLADWSGITHADPVPRLIEHSAHVVTFIFSTGLLIWGFFRLRPSYSVYLCGIWILTFCYSFWMSLPRFVLGMFPMFFLIALFLKNKPVLQFAAGFAAMLLYALCLQQFVRGWWAY